MCGNMRINLRVLPVRSIPQSLSRGIATTCPHEHRESGHAGHIAGEFLDGCRLFAVDEAFWNLGSRRTLWRSERLPVGNGLRFHSLTSCRFAERHAFRRAPFRYPASDRAVLSNNFLEVGYNFLGLAVGPVRFVRGNSSTVGTAMTASNLSSWIQI